MNPKHFSSVLALSPRERYDYFIKRVSDWEELWGPFDDGWASLGDGEGREFMPLWPHEEFARHYTTGEWEKFVPRRIALQDWLSKWTEGLMKSGKGVAVFPTPTGKCTTAEPDRLRHDLQEEMAKLE